MRIDDSLAAIALTLGLVTAVVLGVAGPALAHGGGTNLAVVIDRVAPALPAGVEVDVVATQVATMLVVTNPTDDVLEVAGADGTPWLRVSAAGVEVEASAPDTYASTNPTGGGVPADVLDGTRAPGWVRVSAEPTWSWFEHRLHPEGLTETGASSTDDDRPGRILDFAIPMLFGGAPVTVEGGLEVRTPTGIVTVAFTEDVPDGITAQVVAGGIPGILLTLDGAEEVVVIGLSGEPYLRFTADGVLVDVASPTHRAVEAARGSTLDPLDGPAAPDFQPLTARPSHAWLETRARGPQDVPEDVREGGRTVDLVEWEVPLLVDGEAAVLAGVTRWEPLEPSRRSGPVGSGVVAAVAAGLAVLLLLRRRRSEDA